MDRLNATTEQIHERLFYMAKKVTEVLERHDIPYSIAYGTLLGAVRHKGFIPWDEDFDLWLFDDSYEVAVKYLREELSQDLFVEDEHSEPKYFHQWAHVKDLNSALKHTKYLHDDCYEHNGLSIDLYRLKQVKEYELWKFLNDENRRYIERRWELGLMSNEEYEDRLKRLEEDKKKENQVDKTKEEDVYALIIPYKCKRIYKRNVFPLKKYAFEDSAFFGVNQADIILSDIYGDYMTPTPVDQREGGHSYVEIY